MVRRVLNAGISVALRLHDLNPGEFGAVNLLRGHLFGQVPSVALLKAEEGDDGWELTQLLTHSIADKLTI